MKQLKNDLAIRWAKNSKAGNLFTPKFVDASCPACARSFVQVELNWQRAPCTAGHCCVAIRCNACSTVSMISLIGTSGTGNEEALLFQHPSAPIDLALEEGVAETSPAFVKIVEQAAQAEELGLDEIAGVGYRRAFEFLIKDHLISIKPDSAEQIKGQFLGSCIAEHVDDPRLARAAKRTAWLGNDETHYERRWKDKDLQDMKTLLSMTRHWISVAYLDAKLESEMPRKPRT